MSTIDESQREPAMSTNNADEPAPRKPLRLWPGVVAAVLLCVLRFVLPIVVPEATVFGVIGSALGALAIVVWWVFFSRAPWSERLGAIILMIVALFATSRLVHESIAGGAMGMLLYVLAVPVLSLALVAWALASRRLASGLRRASMVATILLVCGIFTLVRTGGTTSDVIGSDFHWRWTPTPEERLLAQAADEPTAPPPAPAAAETPKELPVAKAGDEQATLPAGPSTPKTEPATPAAVETGADWPGFRGPGRDSIIRGVRIETDWSKSPPVALWRRPIGPGWSSFAVRSDLLYTQEQRGDDEIVACYKVSTGEPVWRHRNAVRFWESNGGAGPRATPTLSNGRVYTFGATGVLNALDAGNGTVVWSRKVASDTDTKVPTWGFASSPLVVDDVVIVAAAGTLAAYDLATGKPRWVGPHHGGSYSSPQLVTIDGVAQILLLSPPGAISVAPADGALLWEYSWEGGAIVQPALTADGDVLINAMAMTGGMGTRRIVVAHGPGGWTVEERWTSNGLKPYFNDFVVHKGHAFGFDGSILACIDLEDGKRKWKGGRYGNGQLVLLPDQDLLLVLSEEGELALVAATTDKFTELARFPALDGKTWNHPVLVGDVLLVRNGQEMASFRLSLAGR
ncbi:MAG: PQQ-binding-like beta-propeller repeat protein [Acidobacteriota bacterium]